MPFLGNTPSNTFVSIAKQTITGNGGATYTLSYAVTSANDLDVYYNNVRQEPGVAYTANGTSITFSENILVSDSVYILFKGQAIATIGTPIGSVGPASLDVASQNGTGALQFPIGTLAQRPISPNSGMQRYNSTSGQMEIYQSNVWQAITTAYSIDYLVVAGGAGGGYDYGGGGGAGGYLASTNVTITPGSQLTITVGAGGAAGTNGAHSYGYNGANSSIIGASISTTTIGGGGGAGNTSTNAAQAGGSGGGGAFGSMSGASGTTGQGNSGSAGINTSSNFHAGGGGGAGTAGYAYTSGASGNGGTGLQWLNGTYYAGGGGGGGYIGYGVTFGTGGTGGGGNGGLYTQAAIAGTANTGGGGGGDGGGPGGNPGAGGSGIVIIRYQGSQRATGGAVTSSGGYTYHTFTTSGTFTA